MGSAASFYRHFSRAYADKCAGPGHDDALRMWMETGAWTENMIGLEAGVLCAAARPWAAQEFEGTRVDCFREFRKVDLTAAEVQTPDVWWRRVPLALIEHENGHDIQVEVWNLASQRAALKVLVFYYLSDLDLERKLARSNEIMTAFNRRHHDASEFLILVASFTFGSGLDWQAFEWRGSSFVGVAP